MAPTGQEPTGNIQGIEQESEEKRPTTVQEAVDKMVKIWEEAQANIKANTEDTTREKQALGDYKQHGSEERLEDDRTSADMSYRFEVEQTEDWVKEEWLEIPDELKSGALEQLKSLGLDELTRLLPNPESKE